MLNPREIKSLKDAQRIVEESQLSHIKVGLFDIDGIMRGKYMSREKFFSALEHGFNFSDVILGWDSQDSPYVNSKYTGWHTGYPDAHIRIIPQSCREVVFEENELLFIAEFTGPAANICPRNVLQRVLKKAEKMGFDVFASLEYEFFMFNETPDSARAKRFQNLKTFTPGNFSYSILRNTVHAELYHQIINMSEVMDFPIESLHTETGPGVLEAALTYDLADAAADKAALFKTFMKVLAQRNNLMATFMAKWSQNHHGQGGHMHISLRNKESSTSAFYDSSKPHNMSSIQRYFLGGQQRLMPELSPMFAPTINSYKRLIPGSFAPTDATWGIENRTTALRVIPGDDKSQRIEHRFASADANPYLALAAAIGSGLYGIEHKLEPMSEVIGNAYDQSHDKALQLPSTLWEATQRLKKSEAACCLFGETFVGHFALTREWEEREFRRHITNWELNRYFEII